MERGGRVAPSIPPSAPILFLLVLGADPDLRQFHAARNTMSRFSIFARRPGQT
jgi:hypothetical protein